jgi:hypothetical protein
MSSGTFCSMIKRAAIVLAADGMKKDEMKK